MVEQAFAGYDSMFAAPMIETGFGHRAHLWFVALLSGILPFKRGILLIMPAKAARSSRSGTVETPGKGTRITRS